MRFPATVILVPLCVLLLTSCFRRVPEELPPREVLRRTILNSIMLEAVNIEAIVTLKGTVSRQSRPPVAVNGSPFLASLVLTGTLAPLQHAWVIDLGGTITGPTKNTVRTRLELTKLPSGNVYLRVDDLRSAGDVLRTAGSGSIIGRPVRIVAGTVHEGFPAMPDPHVVDTYASAIDIISGGLQKTPDGSFVYRYGVRINPATLHTVLQSGTQSAFLKEMAITGDLTIDPELFVLSKADWILSSIPSALGAIDATVAIRFHDHNVTQLSLPALTGSDVRIRNYDDLYRFPSMGIEEP